MEHLYNVARQTFKKPESSFVISPILSTHELFSVYNQLKQSQYSNLLVITEGRGEMWIDMENYAVHANCVFIIKPGQSLRIENTVVKGFLLSFTMSCFQSDDENFDSDNPVRLLRFFSKQLVFLNPEIMNDLQETLLKMIKEMNSENLFRAELLKRYFKILLIYMIRQEENEEKFQWQNRNTELTEKFLSLLEKNFTSRKMVSDYASLLFVSPNCLNQSVKKMTGDCAGTHIRKRIMLEAKRKAVYSNKSMKEIGYMLGFEDPAHFSKLFKKMTGVNFISFRKQLLAIPCIPEL